MTLHDCKILIMTSTYHLKKIYNAAPNVERGCLHVHETIASLSLFRKEKNSFAIYTHFRPQMICLFMAPAKIDKIKSFKIFFIIANL